jgi:hypothetical protein
MGSCNERDRSEDFRVGRSTTPAFSLSPCHQGQNLKKEREEEFFLLQLFNLSNKTAKKRKEKSWFHCIYTIRGTAFSSSTSAEWMKIKGGNVSLCGGDSFRRRRLSVEESENRRAIAADADWKEEEEAFTLPFFSMLIINDGWFLSLFYCCSFFCIWRFVSFLHPPL